jgi:small-conductance mechanosensitive channel
MQFTDSTRRTAKGIGIGVVITELGMAGGVAGKLFEIGGERAVALSAIQLNARNVEKLDGRLTRLEELVAKGMIDQARSAEWRENVTDLLIELKKQNDRLFRKLDDMAARTKSTR